MSSYLRKALLGLLLMQPVLTLALSAGTDKKTYSQWEKAAYLTQEEIEFIRPGLQLTIVEVTIPDDRRPMVTYRIADDRGLPLDLDGVLTPGSVSASFILAYIPPGGKQYVAYTSRTQTSPITGVSADQPSRDRGGSTTMIDDGVYRYRFGTVLPADYPQNATTTLYAYSTRDLRPYGLIRHVVNVERTWVPDGSPVVHRREVSTTAACNQCHNPLALHGGSRMELGLCNVCHIPNAIDPDTGNTVDMKVMAHKIHMGANLPSVQSGTPYKIVGHNQSVHDYSHVVFPQDIRNCETCHKDAAQAENWFKEPTRATCESCHDSISWATGEGHVGGPQVSDRFCATCHFPEGDLEYDASIKGAHTVPRKSRQLRGININIIRVLNRDPGSTPVVHYTLTENDGTPLAPSDLAFFNFNLAGPTSDYAFLSREAAIADSRPRLPDGWSYTFKTALPAGAAGQSFSVSAEAYRMVNLNPGTVKEFSHRETEAENPILYFGVGGASAAARRSVVSEAKCNACHEKLELHGTIRHDPQYCVVCHTPSATDVNRRPDGTLPPETIDFRTLIHKIHTGEDLSRAFTVYGFGNRAHDYTHVLYPGDRRDCEQCHLSGTWNIPLPEGRLAVATPRDFITPTTPPETAACLSCHDSRTAAAHAFVQIAPFGEACGACHGANAEFAVAKSHAR